MCPIPSSTRSTGYGEISWEDGDTSTAPAGKNHHQELITQANSKPLELVLKLYGVQLNAYGGNIVCPFKSHKGGREKTGSFHYYADTNSYQCFGCKVGRKACDFVAEMDHCSRSDAAIKILGLFGDEPDQLEELYDYGERLDIMASFSNAVREFSQEHSDEESFKFIEMVCRVYDRSNLENKLGNVALKRLVEQLLKKISTRGNE